MAEGGMEVALVLGREVFVGRLAPRGPLASFLPPGARPRQAAGVKEVGARGRLRGGDARPCACDAARACAR
jgi:hypothetical protein